MWLRSSESGGVVSCAEDPDAGDQLLEWLDRSTNTEAHNALLNRGEVVAPWQSQ